jgi:predicted transcriptional regulator
MARPSATQPTEVELQILGVLWELGPSSVRQVHQALADQRGTGYSTTLKMMQVMLEKGLVRRNDTVRPQVYRAAKSKPLTQVQMLDDLTQKVFGGSAKRLVMRMVSTGRLSPDEMEEIQRLAKAAEGERK